MKSLFLFSGRKGQGSNYFAVVLFLFTFGFLSMLGMVIFSAMISAWMGTGLYVGEVAAAGASFMSAMLVFDKLVVLVMALLIVGVGVTSYRLATSNVYYVVTFLLAAFYGFVSYFFNYLFVQLVSNSVFSSVITFFPLTILVCTNLHWIILVCIVVGSVTLFGKKETGQFVG